MSKVYLIIASIYTFFSFSSMAGAAERRCGWFDNPTPSNAVLYDKDDEWIISVQSGHQAEGDWPVFNPAQWVETQPNGYGYGCACMTMEVDRGPMRVLRIADAQARPLSSCRTDKALRKWEWFK